MKAKKVLICAVQVPFVRGGAEVLVAGLYRELIKRGFETDIVTLPFQWQPKLEIIRSCLIWRLLDLSESNGQKVDLIICTKFPSYVAKHPNKVVWLVHQHRQAYDWHSTPYSDFTDDPEDERIRQMIVDIDRRALGEAKRIYTISRNVSGRLAKYNGLGSIPLYPPTKHKGKLHSDGYGDYILYVGRLDAAKRVDLLIQAMKHVISGARCLIAGAGPERGALEKLAHRFGLEERIRFLGYVGDEELINLYANCFAVFYAPFDEDYGFATVEAFQAAKPVLTTTDSGGVLEFVQDGRSGCVVESDPREIAAKIDHLYNDKRLCEKLGKEGSRLVEDISWDNVISELTG